VSIVSTIDLALSVVAIKSKVVPTARGGLCSLLLGVSMIMML
jgi:hypothetical protein